ncbi:condensation domain-containing protein [Calothrix rhizosoleniae]|uniref:condensation domain-containing protein n=1 Tax=Calothrix rhizosoleniae TaxID=888997 RepID=UPI000B4A1084|nr:condensation domain-containing protein [Calothrix rhizosoleniae]
MESGQDTSLRRKIGSERILLMLPLNVVMVGRIRGAVVSSRVAVALEQLRSRHPLLAVRVQIADDGTGLYVASGVPTFVTHVEPRQSEEQWIARVKSEWSTPFPIETGPLVRCSLIHSQEVSEIILCGHHAICDGMSLGYLLCDLLKLLTEPEQGVGELVDAPVIDSTTVPTPPSMNPFGRFIMGWINKQWASKRIRFGETDMRRMHEAFWKKNSQVQVVPWTMDAGSTEDLVSRCRAENVTVNTALWTAFLAAQYDIHFSGRRYRQRSALAVNTRDKLTVPVGDAFGFYASSLTVKLPYDGAKSFWDNARQIHTIISNELARTNLFRMLSAELVHPTLLDSLYFSKYGLLDEAMPKMLLRKMGWHKVTYGYAITNVGRFDIPTVYGSLKLEAVYGPSIYSDVEEKIVGVITVGGRLSCILTCNESVVGDGTRLRDAAMTHLEEAVKEST